MSVSARTIAEREATDQNYWATSDRESPQADFLHALLNKAGEARILVEKLDAYRSLFAPASSILELGGGQCWASCIVKRLHPQAEVVGTDIAEAAIASVGKWEHTFGVKVDRTVACQSYATPFADGSFDVIFAFAAAHHFGLHRETFREAFRLLRPGGTLLYMHDPVCRGYIYPLARWRAQTRRPNETTEDVIVYKALLKQASEARLVGKVEFQPTLLERSPLAMGYFFGMHILPVLQHVLPTSADMMFQKPRAAEA